MSVPTKDMSVNRVGKLPGSSHNNLNNFLLVTFDWGNLVEVLKGQHVSLYRTLPWFLRCGKRPERIAGDNFVCATS